MDTLELRCGGTQVHIDRFGAMFTAEFTVKDSGSTHCFVRRGMEISWTMRF